MAHRDIMAELPKDVKTLASRETSCDEPSDANAQALYDTVEELLPSLTLEPRSSPSEAECHKNLDFLPSELLQIIVPFLDGPPPSEVRFNSLPNPTWIISDQQPLKALSSVSRRLRLAVLPRLYRHTKLDPCCLTDFLTFVHRADLAGSIESVTASILGAFNYIHPAWYTRLLNEVPLKRFTIGCKPHDFAKICDIAINMQDSWAFDMPYQLLELRQSAGSAVQSISYDALPGILGAKHWTSIKVNEGSCLAAYSSYEYFHKKPPSIMANLHNDLRRICDNSASVDVAQDMPDSRQFTLVETLSMLKGVQEFSFVAVCPFYNHVDDVLKSIRRMSHLRKLSINLCPELGSTVLDDAIKAAGGHIDLNDPWTEVLTGYSLIGHTVHQMGVEARLDTVVVGDIKIEGVHDAIVKTFDDALLNHWSPDGKGTWTKDVPSLPDNTSTIVGTWP